MNRVRMIVTIGMFALLIGFMVSSTQVEAKSNVTATLKNGTLTIQGKGKMPKKMVFKNNKKIKKVVIKNGVTSVSNNAFNNCKNLKKVTLAKSVKTIGRYAFQNTKITEIKIPKSVKTIKRFAFYGCKKLKKITVGKSVENIGSGAFWGTAITSIKIPKKVTTIGNSAFYRCKNLEKVTLGKSVEKIGKLAFASTKVTSIKIPKSVKTIGSGAFNSENKIDVTIPGNLDMSALKNCAIRNAGKITFTTNLNIENIQYLESKNFEVMESDPNYCSINGNIYTKDKKTLVRIPALSRNVKVEEGCEIVCISAFEYNVEYNFKLALNKTIENLYLPETVKAIDDEKYITYKCPENMLSELRDAVKIKNIESKNKELNIENLLK